MKIIVDAMGGDNAPLEIVRGALDANRNHGVEIILVGRTAEVLKAVEAGANQPSRHASYIRLYDQAKQIPDWAR